jgi:hypothetical protein
VKSPKSHWNPKCRGKVCHGSRADALAVRDRMIAAGQVAVGELESYRCLSCHMYHLGHPIGWSRMRYEAHISNRREYQ